MNKYPLTRTIEAMLQTIGQSVAAQRKSKQWRQIDLAERLGVTRQTIAKIEQGDASVNIGIVYSALWLLDLPILPGLDAMDKPTNNAFSQLITLLNQQQAQRIKSRPEGVVDDDF